MPIPPITMRSLAAGRSLLPRAAEVMMKGTPNAAPAPAPAVLRNSRRVDRFLWVIGLSLVEEGGFAGRARSRCEDWRQFTRSAVPFQPPAQTRFDREQNFSDNRLPHRQEGAHAVAVVAGS